jgi:hypothetical protein
MTRLPSDPSEPLTRSPHGSSQRRALHRWRPSSFLGIPCVLQTDGELGPSLLSSEGIRAAVCGLFSAGTAVSSPLRRSPMRVRPPLPSGRTVCAGRPAFLALLKRFRSAQPSLRRTRLREAERIRSSKKERHASTRIRQSPPKDRPGSRADAGSASRSAVRETRGSL